MDIINFPIERLNEFLTNHEFVIANPFGESFPYPGNVTVKVKLTGMRPMISIGEWKNFVEYTLYLENVDDRMLGQILGYVFAAAKSNDITLPTNDTRFYSLTSKVNEILRNFFKYWKTNEFISDVYNEIETNGTVVIEDELFKNLTQINCSPKLANSGMTEKQRIKPEAIKRIMEHDNYQFKFVISTEEDILELFRDFVEPFEIPLKNVVCMPGLDSQDDFHERTQFCLEMAKKYKFTGMTRLHISAWDKTLNV